MASRDPKKTRTGQDEKGDPTQRDRDEAERERHSTGVLGELDGGGVQFRPRASPTPTGHPELADEPKRGLDPPTDPPDSENAPPPNPRRGS